MSAVPNLPSSFADYHLHDIAVSDLVSSTCRASPVSDGTRGEDVALRIVQQRLVGHRRATDGFLHVSKRVAAIDHPHILRVVDMGVDGGVPYAASVWRDGMPLSTLLLEAAPLEIPDVLRLGGQLAEALDTVHDHGIVHGTVGLPTVWIKRRPGSRVPPSAALTAFGSSHLLAPILTSLEDAEAAVDVLFIAPEQLRGEPAGPAADQYALAGVLFTALTGTTPFRGDTNNDLFGAHLFSDPPRLSATRDDLDPSWDDLFARALSKEPDERFENCRTMLLAAGRCAHGGGPRRTAAAPTAVRAPGTVPVTVDTSAADADPWWRRRLLRIVLVIALLATLAVLAAIFGVGR
ncbi:hypothetical protein BH23ACT10_BH23ACT10_32900 [soil metagenome]